MHSSDSVNLCSAYAGKPLLIVNTASHCGYPPYHPVMMTALQGLFVQVLKLCQRAGLVKLGHVALDGTKLKANASRHKAMSYGRMPETEARLKREVRPWFERAATVDTAEDREHGARRGDELPEWVADKQARGFRRFLLRGLESDGLLVPFCPRRFILDVLRLFSSGCRCTGRGVITRHLVRGTAR